MSVALRVAVVGSTGVVGTTMLELLRERQFPAREIVPFAVTLEFDDALRLRKFVADQLFRARETKFRAHH